MALLSTGLPSPGLLPTSARTIAERHLGVDLEGTTISEASECFDVDGIDHRGGPLAVARDGAIRFAPGQLRPKSRSAAYLLGHELTHVAQQRLGQARVPLWTAGQSPMPALVSSPPGVAQRRAPPPVHERILNELISAKSRGDDPERSHVKDILLSLSPEDAETLFNRLTSGSRRDDFVLYFNTDANVPPLVRADLLKTLQDRFGALPGVAGPHPEGVTLKPDAAMKTDDPPRGEAAAGTDTKAKIGTDGDHAAEGTSGLLRWPSATDAFRGIVPFYGVRALPQATFSPAKAPRRGPYRIVANLRHGAGDVVEVLYFTAYRVEPGLTGPTNWEEYAIGPSSIDEFIAKLDTYSRAAAGAYMFGPPRPNAVEGARFVESALKGEGREAVDAYEHALYESVTDPGWVLQMLMALAALGGGGGARPSAGGAARPPFVPRVIAGGGAAIERVPASIVGNTALKLDAVPGLAARLQAVPAPLVDPVPIAPTPVPAAVPAAGVAAVGLASPGNSPNQAPSTSSPPAPAPATAQTQPKKPAVGGQKVADSNIFQDRPERNTRATIDALYLSNPGLTLFVPAVAITEATRNDPFGTQAARLRGLPGGAKIIPDADGNVAPLAPLFPKILSSKFGEADLRIALRAQERVLPLLTAQATMALQVRDANFPERVKVVGAVAVEVVP